MIMNKTDITKKMFYRFNFMMLAKTPGIWIIALMALSFTTVAFSPVKSEYITDSNPVYAWRVAAIIIIAAIIYGVARQFHRNFKKIKGTSNTFVFETDYFQITSESPVTRGTIQNRYNVIQKAIEKKEMFYIYIDQHRAFLLSKDGFVEGSSVDLRQLLSEKLSKKFKY